METADRRRRHLTSARFGIAFIESNAPGEHVVASHVCPRVPSMEVENGRKAVELLPR